MFPTGQSQSQNGNVIPWVRLLPTENFAAAFSATKKGVTKIGDTKIVRSKKGITNLNTVKVLSGAILHD